METRPHVAGNPSTTLLRASRLIAAGPPHAGRFASIPDMQLWLGTFNSARELRRQGRFALLAREGSRIHRQRSREALDDWQGHSNH
jgi:hypothetical protein